MRRIRELTVEEFKRYMWWGRHEPTIDNAVIAWDFWMKQARLNDVPCGRTSTGLEWMAAGPPHDALSVKFVRDDENRFWLDELAAEPWVH